MSLNHAHRMPLFWFGYANANRLCSSSLLGRGSRCGSKDDVDDTIIAIVVTSITSASAVRICSAIITWRATPSDATSGVLFANIRPQFSYQWKKSIRCRRPVPLTERQDKIPKWHRAARRPNLPHHLLCQSSRNQIQTNVRICRRSDRYWRQPRRHCLSEKWLSKPMRWRWRHTTIIINPLLWSLFVCYPTPTTAFQTNTQRPVIKESNRQ